MSTPFDGYVKKRDFLVCVDSDGCAMDTMDIKHFRCFGPCMVEEWGLEAWRDALLARWNEINLYTMTRGINRFKALAIELQEVNDRYTPIEGLAEYVAWAENARELSNNALAEAAKGAKGPCLAKALHWSQSLNVRIAGLPEEEVKPFAGAKEGLAAIHEKADVAIVSSANPDAVLAEWKRFGLLEHTDIVLAQDAGTKAHCIGEMLKKGYAPDHVLMVGDAPGDKAAAEKNGVYYYPILVRREAESWAELKDKGLAEFLSGSYGPYGEEKAKEFLANLGG